MRPHRWIAIALTLLVLPAVAQTTPTPPQNSAQPEYTLRTRVPIALLDIVVTDAKGRPVHNLHQSDLTILEDNQPMAPNKQGGAVKHQEIDVPSKGDFILRIAVHDLNSDRTGAIEIPTTAIHPEPAPASAIHP